MRCTLSSCALCCDGGSQWVLLVAAQATHTTSLATRCTPVATFLVQEDIMLRLHCSAEITLLWPHRAVETRSLYTLSSFVLEASHAVCEGACMLLSKVHAAGEQDALHGPSHHAANR